MMPGPSLHYCRDKKVKLLLQSHVAGELEEEIAILKGVDNNGVLFGPEEGDEFCFVPFHRVHRIELLER